MDAANTKHPPMKNPAKKSKAPFIRVEEAYVRYPVPLSGSQRSAFGAIASRVAGSRAGNKAGSITYVEALRGATLELVPGDRLGLIGRNGAGKSTMLKLLAGLLPPSEGSFESRGSSMNMLTLGAGMDGEMSGIENIRRMCRFLQIPRSKWKDVEEDVSSFTELGTFLAMPMRTYSAGMSVRLCFGMATAYPRDILVIDEIIGAGDAAFFEKAKTRMDKFIADSSILVIASHSEGIIKEFCGRAIYLDRGQIVVDGEPDLAWGMYKQSLGIA